MSAFLPAIALIVLGLYAYVAVAPGVATIPIQWRPGHGVNKWAPRALAFGMFPVLGLVAIAVLWQVGSFGATIGGIVLLLAQILHIVLVRNWYAKSST